MKKYLYLFLTIILCFTSVSFVSARPEVENNKYHNFDDSVVSCGNKKLTDIPEVLPKVIKIVYIILEVAVPIVLVIFGMLDLVKAIYSSKDDEIKKAQQLFVKRLITAALMFFVFAIVKLLISVVADGGGNDLLECAECFLKDECD